MSRIAIARRRGRNGLLISKNIGGKSIIFPLMNTDRGELDELIRGILEKGGITDESIIQTIIDDAEKDWEFRIKLAEVKAETRRLMRIRAAGGKLMQIGFRKWKQAFYPATKIFTG